MSRFKIVGVCKLWLLVCLWNSPALALDLQIDYSYDTNNFFGGGNPQGAAAGAQAKLALDAAAGFYSAILTDTFDSISTPTPYHSNIGGSNGVVTWTWSESFQQPSTGNAVNRVDDFIGVDQFRIYVGARPLSGATAGVGGPGGYSWQSAVSGTNIFSPSDIANINSITNSFSDAVEHRGETSGFARWGGTVSFDNDGSTPWSFSHLSPPASGTRDFYSVAIHELAHVLGFGTSNEFSALVSGNSFVGPAATSHYGIPVPLSGTSHWFNTFSAVYGTATSQEAAMTPDLFNGTRKLLTTLDAAALSDIGWSLGPVPEPGTATLAIIVALFACPSRHRR